MSQRQRLTLSMAILLAAQYQERLAHGLDPRVFALRLGDWFDRHYLPVAQQTQRSWRSTRSRFDRHIRPVLGGHPLGVIVLSDLQRLVDGLVASGYSAATINRDIAVLKVVFKLACRQGVLQTDPTVGLRRLRERNQRGRILRAEEYAPFFSALQEAPPLTRGLVLLLLLTGIRLSEALKARWEHVDWEQGWLRLPETKSGRPRVVPLSASARVILTQLREQRVNDWIFPGRAGKPMTRPSRAFRRVLMTAGIEGLWLHDLRRTFASLAATGVPLTDVSRVLGHSSTQVTERYVVTGEARLAGTAEVVNTVFGAFLPQPKIESSTATVVEEVPA